MDLQALLTDLKGCPCGREHTVSLKKVEIYSGAVHNMGNMLRELGFPDRLHVVADENTLSASNGLIPSLEKAGFKISMTLYDDMHNATSEAQEQIMVESADAGAILAVGTGSINDMSRLTAFKKGIDYAIFATAPSMDGFASTVSAITENGFKNTHPGKSPVGIFADCDILGRSPIRLKAAGFADIMGKYTSLADWKIANLVTGEYYCNAIADLTVKAVNKCKDLADKVSTNEPEAAGSLMEALVISGVAMQLAGNSRPASAAEHHISHFWEMMFLRDGIKEELHGKKVGIAEGIVADYYHRIAQLETIVTASKPFQVADIKKAFGDALAAGIIHENTPDPLDEVDTERLKAVWPEVRKILLDLPSSNEIKAILKSAHAATEPFEAHVEDDLVEKGIVYGRYVRRRLTVLRMSDLIANFSYKYNG
ncbi:MAG: sn-glycerol-1-phosphate dehydrogenase [Bacillota bacterium]|nr:sn-glycerol-1-phosphate dehydrogenase [Bacillota bacterium]